MHPFFTHRASLLVLSGIAITALIAGCSSPPKPTPPVAPAPPPAPVRIAPPPPPPPPPPQAEFIGNKSAAQSAREYRRDAAGHLYSLNSDRIYKGKMPPLLYAVGVIEVHVDGRGNVVSTSWMRKPSHAPEVVAEIERTVRKASPYPAPVRLGSVTYTDTWLWHKSGKFQLDTLTEGQL